MYEAPISGEEPNKRHCSAYKAVSSIRLRQLPPLLTCFRSHYGWDDTKPRQLLKSSGLGKGAACVEISLVTQAFHPPSYASIRL